MATITRATLQEKLRQKDFVAREIDRRDELIRQYQAAEGLLDRLIKSQDDEELRQLGREFLKQYHAGDNN